MLDKLDFLHYVLVIIITIVCPFTKVEESFNIQAIHDIIHYGPNLSMYDHHAFSGVVPRTFLGALTVAIPSFPLIYLVRIFSTNKILELIIVRCVLGLAIVTVSGRLRRVIAWKYGRRVSLMFFILTLSQFHGIFYASRTLPNTFAQVMVMESFAQLLKQTPDGFRGFLRWITFAGVVFRSELVLLYLSVVGYQLFTMNTSIRTVLSTSIPIGICALFLTVLVDSVFWNRWLYPEGEVLYFNTILGKSKEWGTSPFYYYFSRHLPALLLVSYPLALLSLRDLSLSWIYVPVISYVAAYSFLGHKEARFIVYTVPLWNLLAAVYLSRLRTRSFQFLMWSCGIVASFLILLSWTYVSSFNYPGGVALRKLHDIIPESTVRVHLDVYPCMTGISRFVEQNRQVTFFPGDKVWVYTKEDQVNNATYIVTDKELNYPMILEQEGYAGLSSKGIKTDVLTRIYRIIN